MTVLNGAKALAANAMLNGEGDDGSRVRRLVAAAQELLALAAELDGAVNSPSAPDCAAAPSAPPLRTVDDARWTLLARDHYRDRRLREVLFNSNDLFGEPAWDLLLDLFIAAREGKRVPVTSACIGAAVPTTTALRWLAVLERDGLVQREADASDARRAFVSLSPVAYARMAEYFARSSLGRRDEQVLRGAEAESAPFMLARP